MKARIGTSRKLRSGTTLILSSRPDGVVGCRTVHRLLRATFTTAALRVQINAHGTADLHR